MKKAKAQDKYYVVFHLGRRENTNINHEKTNHTQIKKWLSIGRRREWGQRTKRMDAFI